MDFATSPPSRPQNAPDSVHDIAMMARNGIVRVPADQYHVDGFRYSNLADALAQVVRRSAGGDAS